jgi:hypothetical protein
MIDKNSALYSEFVIDGVKMSMTPIQLLTECMTPQAKEKYQAEGLAGQVVDESLDSIHQRVNLDSEKTAEYLKLVVSALDREVPLPMSILPYYAKHKVARTIIDSIWRKGFHTLEDLSVSLKFRWNSSKMGSMAAFYSSVEALVPYLFELDVLVDEVEFCEAETNLIDVEVLPQGESKAFDFDDDPSSWLVFVPFDTCSFKLGGSVLSAIVGDNGDRPSDVHDSYYFADCYEVVRELVEDGVATGGVTVGEGGLLCAVRKMLEGVECGVEMNVGGVMSAYSGTDELQILFAHVPGVVLQISDSDYDYVDSQFVLQDIAYFPLGHPKYGVEGVSLQKSVRSGVSGILASLLNGQAAEGED